MCTQGTSAAYHVDHSCRRWTSSTVRVVVSIGAHVSFMVCLVIVLWTLLWGLCQTQPNKDYFLLIASIVGVLAYTAILVEAATSPVFAFIKTFVRNMTAEEYIERVQDARPLVRWHATCYHYEVKSHVRFHHQHSGVHQQAHHRRSRQKVVTLRDTEAFKFSDWKDVTRDVRGLLHKPLIQVHTWL